MAVGGDGMDQMILFFCSLVSCIIIAGILFQFMEERYKRVFKSNFFYCFLPVGSVLFITWVNTFMIPVLNMAAHFFLFGLSAVFFYSGGKSADSDDGSGEYYFFQYVYALFHPVF